MTLKSAHKGKKCMTAAIETKDLTKFFKPHFRLKNLLKPEKGERVAALDRVTFSVEEGEIFALLGPNGAGKTTLVKTLAALILPNAGGARVLGFDIVREAAKVRPLISAAFGEEHSFYGRLTGRQNLEFFAALHNFSRKKTRQAIDAAQSALEIEDLDKPYLHYSTGTRQRLALARSFLTGARLILMDEPTRSLDPIAASKLRTILKDKMAKEGRTVFFTTHNTKEAEELSDRIAILDRGRLKACGTLAEIGNQLEVFSGSLEEMIREAAGQGEENGDGSIF